jgi:hypothetical protein
MSYLAPIVGLPPDLGGYPVAGLPPLPYLTSPTNPPGSAARGTALAVIVKVDNANNPKFASVAVKGHFPYEDGYTMVVGAGPFAAGGTAGFNYFYNNSSGVGGSWCWVDLDNKKIISFTGDVSTAAPTPFYKAITDHVHSGNLNPDGYLNPGPVDLSANQSTNILPYNQEATVVQANISSTGQLFATDFLSTVEASPSSAQAGLWISSNTSYPFYAWSKSATSMNTSIGPEVYEWTFYGTGGDSALVFNASGYTGLGGPTSGYMAYVDHTGSLRIYKFSGGVSSQLTSLTSTYASNVNSVYLHHLRVVCQAVGANVQIAMQFDQSPILTYPDSSSPILSGTFGLLCSATTYTHDFVAKHSFADAQAFLSSQNIDPSTGNYIAGVDLSKTQIGKHLGSIPDDNTSQRFAVAAIDGARKALIDFSQGHTNKTLDYVSDGTNYGSLPLVNVTGSGLAKRALIDFSQSHTNKTIDYLSQGTTQKWVSAVDAANKALIDFTQGHTNKNLDTLANTTGSQLRTRNWLINGSNANGTGTPGPSIYGWTGDNPGNTGATIASSGTFTYGTGPASYTVMQITGHGGKGRYQVVKAIPGATYTYAILVYAETNATAQIYIADDLFSAGQYNSSLGTTVGGLVGIYGSGYTPVNGISSTINNGWQILYGTFTVPLSNTSRKMGFMVRNTGTADHVYFIFASLWLGNRVQDYLDHEPNDNSIYLDSHVIDGINYNRVLASAITSGQVDLSKTGVIGKTLANIGDDAGSSRYAVLAVDGNRRALIDPSQGHVGGALTDNNGNISRNLNSSARLSGNGIYASVAYQPQFVLHVVVGASPNYALKFYLDNGTAGTAPQYSLPSAPTTVLNAVTYGTSASPISCAYFTTTLGSETYYFACAYNPTSFAGNLFEYTGTATTDTLQSTTATPNGWTIWVKKNTDFSALLKTSIYADGVATLFTTSGSTAAPFVGGASGGGLGSGMNKRYQ